MILAIDIGNTNIVVGCFDKDKVLFVERVSTDHTKTELEYAISLKNVLEIYGIDHDAVEGGIISSVVPPLTNVLKASAEKIISSEVLVVGPGIKTGLNILMDNPASVGSDLIVDAVAAISEYPVPLIFVDMGTATTISVIDEEKRYRGGMILPGIRVSMDSLTARTAQLPHISIEPPKRLIGRNTIDCMRSGIMMGSAAMIDGMVERMEAELGQKTTVIATGGIAKFVIPMCKTPIVYDNDLIVKGLAALYRDNKRN